MSLKAVQHIACQILSINPFGEPKQLGTFNLVGGLIALVLKLLNLKSEVVTPYQSQALYNRSVGRSFDKGELYNYTGKGLRMYCKA